MIMEDTILRKARHSISRVSKDCKNPERAYRAMIVGVTARYKLDKAYNRINLLRDMNKYHLALKVGLGGDLGSF